MDGRTRDCCIYPSEEFNQLEATNANSRVRQWRGKGLLHLSIRRVWSTWFSEWQWCSWKLWKTGEDWEAISWSMLRGRCLCHLTATNIIAARKDYSHLSKAKERWYLFTKLEENSSEMLDETIPQDSKQFQMNYFIARRDLQHCLVKYPFFNFTENFDKNAQKNLFRWSHTSHGNKGKKGWILRRNLQLYGLKGMIILSGIKC